jgi:DNA-binding NarL/FixJ family response regulator
MASYKERDPGRGSILVFPLPRNRRVQALRASTRILVADDRAAVHAEVNWLIGSATDMIIIGDARDGRTALRLATELKPDVIILDISMLGLSRVKVVESLRAALSASKILLHISPEDKSALRQLVELGAAGYLLKCSSADELVGAIRAVAGGGFFFDPAGRLDGGPSQRLKGTARVYLAVRPPVRRKRALRPFLAP